MKDKVLKLTKQLIEIPYVSGTGEMDKAIELLELTKKLLPEFKFEAFAKNGVPSLLFTNQPEQMKDFKIILNAHLDVVAAQKTQFTPIEKDNKLYARGAYDMKTAAAVIILLFKELGPKLPYPLGLQIVMDEETGGFEGCRYQLQQGVRAQFAISGEGTNFRIINEAKTRLILKLIAEGKSSHGAYPWLGDNAIWKLQQVIHTIYERFPLPKEESHDTTVNITHISTQNTIYNTTPFHCEAVLDIRYTHDDQNILEYITALLPEGVTTEIIHHFSSHYTKPNSPYIQQLQHIAKKIIGQDITLARAHGTSDMPFFSEVGCEAIEFGLRGGGNHSDHEWTDLSSIEEYYQILKTFLLEAK